MIDLGEISTASSPQVAPPTRDAGRRLGSRALPALVTVLALAASAAPPQAPMRTVADIPVPAAGSVLVHGERIFVVGTHGITAYSLVSGRRQWTAPTGGTTPVRVTVATTALVANDDGDNGGGTTVTALDQATGVVRWSTYVPGGCVQARDDGQSDPMGGFVEFCGETGALTSRDLDTGRPTAHRILQPSTSRAAVNVVDGLVLVERLNDEQMAIDVFRAGDLTRLWGRSMLPDSFVYRCSTGLCEVDGTSLGRTARLDPATGRVLGTFTTPQPVPNSGLPSEFPPTDGSPTTLVVLPAGADPRLLSADRHATFTYPVGDGEMASVLSPGDGSTWVVRQSASGVMPIQHLRGVRADACFAITTYVACTRTGMRLAIWRLP